MKDVLVRELVVVVPLLGLSLFLGIYPKPVLDRIEPAVERAIAQLRAQDRLPQPGADRTIAKEIQKIEREIEARDHGREPSDEEETEK